MGTRNNTTSKRGADGPSTKETTEKPVMPVVKIRLLIDNIMGQRTELLAPVHSTIRAVKDVMATLHGLDPERQSLVRCGGRPSQYMRLEETKTLKEYGIENNERLLMVPTARTGPISVSAMAFLLRLVVSSGLIIRILSGFLVVRSSLCKCWMRTAEQ